MLFSRLLKSGSSAISSWSKQVRFTSIFSSLKSSPVLVSNNRDVYTNLALEHWLYTNLRFEKSIKAPSTCQIESGDKDKIFKGPIVFIWTDEPCVVMGRHQNPWVEATLGFVNKAGIKLARRHSGGGCVYHDENNINISIIGNRDIFEKRQENLKFLAGFLKDSYGVECEPTKRHDLIHSESRLKMTGSAAKLGQTNCYHHFTLLVDTDKEVMETAIRQSQQNFIHTNSSLSNRSKVVNLKELKPELEINQVISDLALAYGERYKTKAKQESRKTNVTGDSGDNLSLQAHRKELESWDWIYGKTPKFKLERQLKIVDNRVEKQVTFRITINRGKFEKFEIEGSDLSGGNDGLIGKLNSLIGTKFTYTDAMIDVVKMLQLSESSLINSTGVLGSEQIFATYLLQMIQEANY